MTERRFNQDFIWIGLLIAVVTGLTFLFLNKNKEEPDAVSIQDIFSGSANFFNQAQPLKESLPAGSPANPMILEKKVQSIDVPRKPYSIQVYSFKDESKARRAMEELKKKSYAAFIVREDQKEKGIWYKVRIGEFANKQDAFTFLAAVRKEYKDSFITGNIPSRESY